MPLHLSVPCISWTANVQLTSARYEPSIHISSSCCSHCCSHYYLAHILTSNALGRQARIRSIGDYSDSLAARRLNFLRKLKVLWGRGVGAHTVGACSAPLQPGNQFNILGLTDFLFQDTRWRQRHNAYHTTIQKTWFICVYDGVNCRQHV